MEPPIGEPCCCAHYSLPCRSLRPLVCLYSSGSRLYATVANFAQLGGGNAFLAAAKPGLEVIAGERDAEPFQSKNVSTNPSKPRCAAAKPCCAAASKDRTPAVTRQVRDGETFRLAGWPRILPKQLLGALRLLRRSTFSLCGYALSHSWPRRILIAISAAFLLASL